MKYFFRELFEKINQFSHKIDNVALLEGQHWVVMNEIEEVKKVLIFRSNKELLVSSNGKVEICRWEYLGYNSILLGINEEHFLYKNEFFDKDVLALKLDGQETPFLLLNETKFGKEINTIENVLRFLSDKYISNSKQVKEFLNKENVNYRLTEDIVDVNYSEEMYLDPINRARTVIAKSELLKLFPYLYKYEKQGVVIYQYHKGEECVVCGDRVFDFVGEPYSGKLRFSWYHSLYVVDGIVRG
ncbi:hypothetical protein [Myroides sp. N17-2]|uniref:hypothetical protein n=1 Tax=Myroides sp. N17-2 TaxID=2030799 RepID=UPI000EFC3E09|nr:hypothetical protein [Myroides sp. N17-2]